MTTMPTRAPLAAWVAIAILSVTVLYAVVDRQVLILLAQPLKADLGLSDTQIGSLQGLGAVLFASIAVIPLGWLADRIDRRLLLACCILVWSVAIASCGLATGYWSLLLCVAFLAAGEAGLSPVVFAMIPELFPERQRMTANFVYYAATILGSGAGIAIAGAVIEHIGLVARLVPDGQFTRETWRLVFFVVAVPGPFLAILIGLIRLNRRPAPARSDATAPHPQDQGHAKLRDYFAAQWPGVLGVYGTYGLALLGATAIATWLPVILMREAGLSAGEVGAKLGGAMMIGSVVGLTIAASAASWLRRKWGALTSVRMMQCGYLTYALVVPLYFLARSPDEMFLIATIQWAAGIGGNSLMPTLMQDIAPGGLRGRVFAISTVLATMFQVISPIAVGLLSDHVFAHAGGLLKSAIAVAAPSMFLAAVTLRLAEGRIARTIQAVRSVPERTALAGSAQAA